MILSAAVAAALCGPLPEVGLVWGLVDRREEDMETNFRDGGRGSHRCLHLGLTLTVNADIALTIRPV